MSMTFGVHPTSTSPAAKRLYEAGLRRQRRIEAERAQIALEQEQLREAIELRKAEAAKRARDAWAEQAIEAAESMPVNMQDIIKQVSAKHKVGVLDILSDRRSRQIARARQEFMYRARHETLHSFCVIGRFIRRDHTSVMHGVSAHAKRMEEGA